MKTREEWKRARRKKKIQYYVRSKPKCEYLQRGITSATLRDWIIGAALYMRVQFICRRRRRRGDNSAWANTSYLNYFTSYLFTKSRHLVYGESNSSLSAVCHTQV